MFRYFLGLISVEKSVLRLVKNPFETRGPFANIYANFDQVQVALDCALNDTVALSESATIALEHGRDVTYARIDNKLDAATFEPLAEVASNETYDAFGNFIGNNAKVGVAINGLTEPFG